MTKGTKRQPKVRSLVELLEEVQSRIGTETLTASQQQDLPALLLNLLTSCEQAEEHGESERGIHAIPGQWHVKRVLEIAAAGGHNLLLVGPPGAGKAELARTLPSLLPIPPLSSPILEPACSIEKGRLEQAILAELTLARSGVLFLKDLENFDLSVLKSLSQMVQTQVRLFPLGETAVVLPAAFLLVASVKPCPCGFLCDARGRCLCSKEEVRQYRERLKEVVHACFALQIEVPLVEGEVVSSWPEDNAAMIRQRVGAARLIQQRRYAARTGLKVNADLKDPHDVEQYCQMVMPAGDLLKSMQKQLHLIPLQVLRVQAVARTIADLDDDSLIGGKYMAEAIAYLPRFIRDE